MAPIVKTKNHFLKSLPGEQVRSEPSQMHRRSSTFLLISDLRFFLEENTGSGTLLCSIKWTDYGCLEGKDMVWKP